MSRREAEIQKLATDCLLKNDHPAGKLALADRLIQDASTQVGHPESKTLDSARDAIDTVQHAIGHKPMDDWYKFKLNWQFHYVTDSVLDGHVKPAKKNLKKSRQILNDHCDHSSITYQKMQFEFKQASKTIHEVYDGAGLVEGPIVVKISKVADNIKHILQPKDIVNAD